MMEPEQNQLARILDTLGFEEGIQKEIIQYGRKKIIRAGSSLISPSSSLDEIPFVLSGSLRVSRKDDQDNEMFLYFLQGGETCSMSITCCIEDKKRGILVVAEEDSKIWMVPGHLLDTWIVKYPLFRRFIFRSYQQRFDEMLTALDSVTFMNMDQRLYKYLLDKKQVSGSYVINKTHQQIASELNTSRVVISRLLKKLERDEKIEQGRNKIEIL